MVELNKKIKFECLEVDELSAEAYLSVLQLITSWVVKELPGVTNKGDIKSLTTNAPLYTINSKKD